MNIIEALDARRKKETALFLFEEKPKKGCRLTEAEKQDRIDLHELERKERKEIRAEMVKEAKATRLNLWWTQREEYELTRDTHLKLRRAKIKSRVDLLAQWQKKVRKQRLLNMANSRKR